MRVLSIVAAIVAASAVAATGDAMPNAVESSALPRIHPNVHRTLREQGTVNIVVTLKFGLDDVLSKLISTVEVLTRRSKIASLVDKLKKNAETTQKAIKALVAKEAANGNSLFASMQSFWISNQIHFKGASADLVKKLSFFSMIAEIREELVLELPRCYSPPNAPKPVKIPSLIEWNVQKIQAKNVWSAGYDGSGVVVGAIDTGVYYEHSNLKDNWRSSYGWFDPVNKTTTPVDGHGHGTHTMASAVGSDGIGVAPGATWMACRGCTGQACAESDLLACGQFMTCPTLPDGTGADCTKAPHVITNSWNGKQGETAFAATIKAWRAAGIVPVFSSGNTGDKCSAVQSPADDEDVIAVGATDVQDYLGYFSAKGPSVKGLLKPDISAPGVDVLSAWNTGPELYSVLSGTSMAAPHVSGVVALLLSRQPDLTFKEIKSLMTSTARPGNEKPTNYTCGNTPDSVYPNNQYGYGRVDALLAFKNLFPYPTTPGLCNNLNSTACVSTYGCNFNEANASCGAIAAPTLPPFATNVPTAPPSTSPPSAPTTAPTSAPAAATTPAPAASSSAGSQEQSTPVPDAGSPNSPEAASTTGAEASEPTGFFSKIFYQAGKVLGFP